MIHDKTFGQFSPWATAEKKSRHDMEVGSKKLLGALWASHPGIMRHLGAQRP